MARLRTQQHIPTDYNLKTGPVLLSFDTSFGIEFIDNIYLTSNTLRPSESDLVFTPQLGIGIAWPVTKLNGLHFNTRIGYTKYLSHPDLDSNSMLLAPDSALSFDFFVGDVKVNLHDRFSLQDDPVNNGTLSGVPKFGQFTNIAGIALLWDLKDLLLSAGYDYISLTTTGSTQAVNAAYNLGSLNRTTQQISLSATAFLSSTISGGLESTLSSTTFPESPANDNQRIGVGPFLNTQLTRYTKVYLSGGMQHVSSEGRSQAQFNTDSTNGANPFLKNTNVGNASFGGTDSNSSNADSFYGSLVINHRLNRFYTDELSIGHENELGLSGLNSTTTYCRYGSVLQINAYVSLNTALYYESVSLSELSSQSSYSRLGARFSTGYKLTKKLSTALSYEITKKTADDPSQSYLQNRIGLQFRYNF